jgi:group I intron endonuclease
MNKAPKSGIYAITNTTNGKVYVGSAVNIAARWRGHLSQLRRGIHHSGHLQAAWNKHGEEAFSFSILQEVKKRESLIEEENRWIASLNSSERTAGYNLCVTAGSQLGMKHSEEARKRMSAAHKGRMKSEAHQEAINAALKGRKLSAEHRSKISSNQLGRRASEETRKKMREAHANPKEKLSPDAYQRMVTANVGRRFSETHRQKIAEANRRRVVSDETRQKISDARRRT